MINYKVDKVKSVRMLDKNTLEPIADLNGVDNVTIESEIEPSSLANEVLSFNHTASFQGEFNYDATVRDIYNKILGNNRAFLNIPAYMECYIPILIQARWHKNPRINKKWLKRYGMKEDKVLVKWDVDTISSQRLSDSDEVITDIGFRNRQYKFRPDQLRKNLKIEMHYE